MDVLGKLFGSETKVKLMRLFLFNPETPFSAETAAERIHTGLFSVRPELATLLNMKLIKRKLFVARVAEGRKGKQKMARRKVSGFTLNSSFPYLHEMQRLLLDTSMLTGTEIVKKLSPAGRLKLVVISGIFIQNDDSRLDVLVVGDHLKRAVVERTLRAMESEIGKELRYAAFETGEFNYRLGLYDKLVRDVLDYPHTVVLDRLGLPPMEVGRRPPL